MNEGTAPKKPITWSLAWDYAAFSELIFSNHKVQPDQTVYTFLCNIDILLKEGTESLYELVYVLTREVHSCKLQLSAMSGSSPSVDNDICLDMCIGQ